MAISNISLCHRERRPTTGISGAQLHIPQRLSKPEAGAFSVSERCDSARGFVNQTIINQPACPRDSNPSMAAVVTITLVLETQAEHCQFFVETGVFI
jgi:hypothetical protein